jgi:hypothetical protein
MPYVASSEKKLYHILRPDRNWPKTFGKGPDKITRFQIWIPRAFSGASLTVCLLKLFGSLARPIYLSQADPRIDPFFLVLNIGA